MNYPIPIHRKNKLIVLGLVSLFLCLSAFKCDPRVPYYDATAYKDLTDIKPQVSDLYDTFTNDNVDTAKIEAARLKLAQIYEYENGKGPSNAEATKQVQLIQQMFERHVKDRLTNGKWTQQARDDAKANIEKAFDIAISTENLKNKK